MNIFISREAMTGATAHDEAHDVFMTLPRHTRISEGEVHQLGSGPKPCRLSLGVRKCSHYPLFLDAS